MNFIEKNIEKIMPILCLIVFTLIGFGIYFHYHKNTFGSVPQTPANFETSLAVPQATTDTQMTLASAVLGNGSTLSGYYCFTLDSNTAIVEYECGTASTTNPTLITNITRGIDPVNGTSSVASLIFSHRTGADVRITDYPFTTIVSGIFNGTVGMTNPIVYSGVSTSTLSTNPNNLVDYASLQGVQAAGTVNATTTLSGIIQFATSLQTASGVSQGSTGAFLVAQNSLFASSSSATTLIPVTQTNGKLNQNFLDLTQGYIWSGLQTFNSATTTFNATTSIASSASNKLILNNIPYVFPSTQGSASTTLFNNGSGTLSWQPQFSFLGATTTSVNTVWTGTSGALLTSLTTTLPISERVNITSVIPNFINVGSNSNTTCTITLSIDGANTTTMDSIIVGTISSGNYNIPGSFSYITNQLSSGSHTFVLGGGGTNSGTNDCAYGLTQFAAFNAGN